MPDIGACTRFDKATKQGEDMRKAQGLLSAAVASVVGKNEVERTVLDGEVVSAGWEAGAPPESLADFRAALALARQPQGTLRALYQGWVDAFIAFNAARLTGSFQPAADPERAAARQEALRACAQLEAEMARLCAAAKKEKQMARRVELNLELKRMEAAHASMKERL